MIERVERIELRAERLHRITAALKAGEVDRLTALLEEVHPGEIADLLESLPRAERELVWASFDAEELGDVLAYADDAVRAPQILDMAAEDLAAVACDLDADDAVDILQDLPEDRAEEVLRSMDAQHRARIEQVLAYPEDCAGGLMDIDAVTVRPDVSLDGVLRYLRERGAIPRRTNRLMVVDRDNRYLGTLRVADLLVLDPATGVADCMDPEALAIPAVTPASEVAHIFEQFDLLTAPVVDGDGRLIGRITVDDVVDVIREESEQPLLSLAGLEGGEDMFAPVWVTARRRALWLGVNLATALLASWVIGLFAATIQTVVALAVLMPVVASMGGIAGSQALTVVVRGIALGQVNPHNAWPLLSRELKVGLLNSLLWALVVGGVAYLWFADAALGAIVGIALVANVVVAAIAGAVIPMGLRVLGIDAALAGGVILTTVTDVVGFVAFLGLGTLVLMG
ncbi:MAG: magnesium transporter [Gammaproteobacteria bacterium]|nr:magnesium transporter [Gammaproteobacteria bacterium]